MSIPESAAPATLAGEVRRKTGLNPATCYQCGKCSAGCPMAVETSLRPHDVLRMLQFDDREQLLSSESIWLCLTCETCTARCPNSCDPARIIDCLRETALNEGAAQPPRNIRAFHNAFLKQIQRSGRLFEMGLIMSYKMRSGALFADVMAAPGMLGRGKLALAPSRIQGLEEIRRIFDACTRHESDSTSTTTAQQNPGTEGAENA